MTDTISLEYYSSIIPRIDADEKAFWTGKLRSDEYKDRQGYLQLEETAGGFCCLGVYANAKGIDRFTRFNEYLGAHKVYYGDRDSASVDATSTINLPRPAWIPFENVAASSDSTDNYFNGTAVVFSAAVQGRVDNDPWGGVDVSYTLPMLNDSKEFSFAQIADIIDYFL